LDSGDRIVFEIVGGKGLASYRFELEDLRNNNVIIIVFLIWIVTVIISIVNVHIINNLVRFLIQDCRFFYSPSCIQVPLSTRELIKKGSLEAANKPIEEPEQQQRIKKGDIAGESDGEIAIKEGSGQIILLTAN